MTHRTKLQSHYKDRRSHLPHRLFFNSQILNAPQEFCNGYQNPKRKQANDPNHPP
ncbi:hypothetical protein NDI38_12470 [Stenomitos frigidus AS-A4]|uniref:Uncharacterized protein n=1 Tax=Stenomitos frigidus AS-A4 TaxID=2933935 RepID=A0ABV0KJ42_9CYAN